jgi:hypothetical protein
VNRISLILVTAAVLSGSGLFASTARAWGPGYGNDRRPAGYVGGYYAGYPGYGGAFGGYGTNVAFYAPNIAYLAPNVALYNGYAGGYGGIVPGNVVPYGVGYGGYGGYAPYQRYNGGCNWGY